MAGERERTLAECEVDNAAAQGNSEPSAVGHPRAWLSPGAEEREMEMWCSHMPMAPERRIDRFSGTATAASAR